MLSWSEVVELKTQFESATAKFSERELYSYLNNYFGERRINIHRALIEHVLIVLLILGATLNGYYRGNTFISYAYAD